MRGVASLFFMSAIIQEAATSGLRSVVICLLGFLVLLCCLMLQVYRKLRSVSKSGIEISIEGTLPAYGWDRWRILECNWDG